MPAAGSGATARQHAVYTENDQRGFNSRANRLSGQSVPPPLSTGNRAAAGTSGATRNGRSVTACPATRSRQPRTTELFYRLKFSGRINPPLHRLETAGQMPVETHDAKQKVRKASTGRSHRRIPLEPLFRLRVGQVPGFNRSGTSARYRSLLSESRSALSAALAAFFSAFSFIFSGLRPKSEKCT